MEEGKTEKTVISNEKTVIANQLLKSQVSNQLKIPSEKKYNGI